MIPSNIRYQVFISSTFHDLQNERRAVIEALMKLDCIPAGMELFPAANDDSWTLIEDEIAKSDYYVLIVGGRYGSTDAEGISFTEREYRLATKLEIPILPFLHAEPGKIPADKSEMSGPAQAKLKQFTESVASDHNYQKWESPEQLGAAVISSLVSAVKRRPRTGWIRADQAASPELLQELAELRLANEELHRDLGDSRLLVPDAKDLLQGDEVLPVTLSFTAKKQTEIEKDGRFNSPTWRFTLDDHFTVAGAFGTVAPLLLDETNEGAMKVALLSAARTEIADNNEYPEYSDFGDFSITPDDFQTIKIQLVALGLIRKGDKRRPVNDHNTYWILTRQGEEQLMAMRALRRPKSGVKQGRLEG